MNNVIERYHKSMKWLIAVFFVPLLLNTVAFQLPADVVIFNYTIVLIFVATSINTPIQEYNSIIHLFIWICILYIILGLINLLREGYGIMSFLARHYSIPVALGIVAYFIRTNVVQRKCVALKFAYAISILFLLQLIFSIYESLLYEDFLVNSYDWNTANKALEYFSALELKERLQIDFFFSQLNVPFQMTFSGMLGQHNHWGTQLPFYFLLFGYTYFATGRKHNYFLVLMALVAVSSLLNTSRFGMIAILVNSIIFFYMLSTYPPTVKRWTAIVTVVVLLYFLEAIVENITIYIALTDTFSSRVDTWDVLSGIVFNRNIFSTLFGSPFRELQMISQMLDWEDYENLSFTLIFERGIPYAVLFIGFLGFVVKKAGGLQQPENLLAWLMVTNMILVSLWSNVLFRFTSFGLVAVMLCIAFLPTTGSSSEQKMTTPEHSLVPQSIKE